PINIMVILSEAKDLSSLGVTLL
ncbi:MAG: hypothetical protein QOF33_1401, partial [Thermomicrobiales bacterium]|nr:hypothetical protein [Thermomicrobiales bacterium]